MVLKEVNLFSILKNLPSCFSQKLLYRVDMHMCVNTVFICIPKGLPDDSLFIQGLCELAKQELKLTRSCMDVHRGFKMGNILKDIDIWTSFRAAELALKFPGQL